MEWILSAMWKRQITSAKLLRKLPGKSLVYVNISGEKILLHKAIQNKICEVLASGIVLLHDSIHLHTAACTQALLEHFSCELFDHPPDSPSLTPRSYHLKNAVLWDVTSCGSCKNRRFRGMYCLHHQDGKKQQARNNISSN
jgi:hypothetical protein